MLLVNTTGDKGKAEVVVVVCNDVEGRRWDDAVDVVVVCPGGEEERRRGFPRARRACTAVELEEQESPFS